MQTSINLASQPYVNLQAIKQRWMMISAVVVCLTLLLGIWTGFVLRKQKHLDTQIKSLQKNCDELNAKISQVQQTLHDSKNVELIRQSEFLNNIIFQKSFNWTAVFEEFETIMPRHVQLIQIQPELRANHELHMGLTASGSREDSLDLLKKLEKSPNFIKPVLKVEAANGPVTTFTIDAVYIGEQTQASKESAAAVNSDTADKDKDKDKKDKSDKPNDKNLKKAVKQS
jgi:type IV pilus assembly protein PilN